MDNLITIQAALVRLLKRKNDDAFVIFENPQTAKFVQFAGSVDQPLLLDLPAQALSEEEFARAVEFFNRLGTRGQRHDVPNLPAGQVGGEFSFNMTFVSVADAAQVALEILESVYLLPRDCALALSEN